MKKLDIEKFLYLVPTITGIMTLKKLIVLKKLLNKLMVIFIKIKLEANKKVYQKLKEMFKTKLFS